MYFDMLHSVYGDNTVDNIFTPFNICRDMLELLDSVEFFKPPMFVNEDYINSHRILDIYCKSGNFLEIAYHRFDVALSCAIPQQTIRDNFILQNLLYGICFDKQAQSIIARRLYERIDYKGVGNIIHGNLLNEGFEERFRDMRFDVVVGNPPYNDDVYLDFVMKGYKLSSMYTLLITPAKWFGLNQLPAIKNNISDMIVYLETQEIFDIRNLDGIACYLIGKTATKCRLINKTKKVDAFNSVVTVDLKDIKTVNIFTNNLVKKLGKYKLLRDRLNLLQSPFGINKDIKGVAVKDSDHPYHLMAGYLNSGKDKDVDDRGYISGDLIKKSLDMVHKYKVCINTMMGNCFYDKKGTTYGLNATFIYEPDVVTPHPYLSLLAFDTYDEAESFNSYLSCKFIKFLMFTAICSQNYTTSCNWRLVPDISDFNCIYEDKPVKGGTPDYKGYYVDSNGKRHCSLYIKYDLTVDEIKVIDSVIRDRI